MASLDTARREEVLPYLETLRDQLAVPMVYVSHNFDEVLRLATHIVLMDTGKTIAQGGVGDMSLNRELRAIIGADAVGAIVEGTVLGIDPSSGLMRVQRRPRRTQAAVALHAAAGAKLRVQLLARDLIVATQAPQHLSVRNILPGVVTIDRGRRCGLCAGRHRYRRNLDHGASHHGRRARSGARAGDAGLGVGEGSLAAQPFICRADFYFKRAPRCMMATIWSSGRRPTVALTAAS